MLMAVDTEATGLDLHHGCKPFYLSTCTKEGETKSWDWPVNPFTREPKIPRKHKQEVCRYLEGHTLLFSNARYDVRVLANVGIDFSFEVPRWVVNRDTQLDPQRHLVEAYDFHDTVLGIHALASGLESKGLKEISERFLDYPADDQKALKKDVLRACNQARKLDWKLYYDPTGARQVDADYWVPKALDPTSKILSTYGDNDVERTVLMWLLIYEKLTEDNLLDQYKKEKKLLPTMYRMETDGITLDKSNLKRKKTQLTKQTEIHGNRVRKLATRKGLRDFNPNSPKQLQTILFDKFNLPVVKMTEKGSRSTDKEVLATLISEHVVEGSQAHHFVKELLTMRTHKSGRDYLVSYDHYALPTDHANFVTLYPSFHQSGTKTSRLSCSNPNGQNISKIAEVEIDGVMIPGPMLREVFAPAPNKVWFAIDYSQLEIRIFAAVAKEQSLIDALAKGADCHAFVASKMYEKPYDLITPQERRAAKAVNFGILYGAGRKKIDASAGLVGAMDLFGEQFPSAKEYMQEVTRQVEETGFVYTLDGYRLDVDRNKPYKGVNYVIQGTAGRIIKNAMLSMDDPIDSIFDWVGNRIVLQIHDELIIEYDTNLMTDAEINLHVQDVCERMEAAGQAMGITTPVDVDCITENWGSSKEYKIKTEYAVSA